MTNKIERSEATARQQLHLLLDEATVPEVIRNKVSSRLLDELIGVGFKHQFDRDKRDAVGEVRAVIMGALSRDA